MKHRLLDAVTPRMLSVVLILLTFAAVFAEEGPPWP